MRHLPPATESGISCPGRSARVSACMDKSRGRCGRVQWRGSGWGVARLLDDHRKRDERLLHAVVHLRARLEELDVQLAGQLLPLLVRDHPAPGQVALVPHEQLQATHTHTAGRTAVSRQRSRRSLLWCAHLLHVGIGVLVDLLEPVVHVVERSASGMTPQRQRRRCQTRSPEGTHRESVTSYTIMMPWLPR